MDRLLATAGENPDSGFSQFWGTVAKELGGLPGVIGGELWNEPFPGDVFGQPEMRDNHHADRYNLGPFYTNITAAIRRSAPDQKKFAIAYEPTWPVGDQDLNSSSLLPSTAGFESLPEPNGVYAFHWYVPPADANLSRYLDARMADAARLQAAPYTSEWNFGAWSPESAEEFFGNVAEFESRGLAYAGWQYKNFQGSALFLHSVSLIFRSSLRSAFALIFLTIFAHVFGAQGAPAYRRQSDVHRMWLRLLPPEWV